MVLETGRTKDYDPFAGVDTLVSINFPAMPDSIELARSVEYMVVNSPVMPDGIHQFKWTNPMTIPFSFKLHSFDKEYCPKGALSLLETTALLHAMALPLSKSGQATKVWVSASQKSPATPPSNGANEQAARAQATDSGYNITPQSESDFNPPVTLRLELIFTEEQKPGIICTGYVKDVKVKLNGPWLRGKERATNLPTSADFEFTFVHVPGYGNNFSVQATTGQDAHMVQAYADDVKERLYDNRNLTLLSDRSYKGFSR
jgi:hypothetical protein